MVVSFYAYNAAVKRSIFPCKCNHCDDQVTRFPRVHIQHLVKVHGMKKKTHCPWCLKGPFATPCVKYNTDHLMTCFKSLTAVKKELKKEPEREYVETVDDVGEFLSSCPTCEAFDPEKDRMKTFGRPVYFSFEYFTKPLNILMDISQLEPLIQFDERSGLGSDIPYFIRLFQMSMNYELIEWNHIFVKACLFEQFNNLFRDEPRVSFLPFGTMCDGTRREDEKALDPKYIHHVHLICMGDKHVFNAHWNNLGIKRDQLKPSGINLKGFTQIKTLHHLINALFYVSNRRSRCSGNFDLKQKSHHMCHYNIMRTITPHGKMYAHMLYEGGLYDYFTDVFGKQHVYNINTISKKNGQYGAPLKDLSKEKGIRGCYIPLGPGFEECETESGYKLFGFPKPIYLQYNIHKTRDPVPKKKGCSDRWDKEIFKFTRQQQGWAKHTVEREKIVLESCALAYRKKTLEQKTAEAIRQENVQAEILHTYQRCHSV